LDSQKEEKKGFAEGFWSKDEIKEVFLDEQRRYMWNRDYWGSIMLPLFALKPDSVILDVGCGLGFVGQSLAEFIPHGKVIGVDLDPQLIEAARKRVKEGGFEAVFDYRVGSVYELPVEAESVDLSICQCLLMHLEEPLKAVLEMRRATKKGGRVVVIEADYWSASFFDTAFEAMNYSLEDRVRFKRAEMTVNLGKKKLGMGDNGVGAKMPYLFFQGGLSVIDVRCIDRVSWLIPPYRQEGNDLELKHLLIPPEELFDAVGIKPQFLAGGGTEQEWSEYVELLNKEHEVRRKQIQEGTYAGLYYGAILITIGEKT